MHLFIIASESGYIMEFIGDTLKTLGNPALVLLLIALGLGIYYFIKRIKEKEIQLAEKEIQIQELHNSALEASVKNLKIIFDISTSIDKNDERSRIMESLLRENNILLKSIGRSLNI